MRRERRPLTHRELASITSRRPVVRRVVRDTDNTVREPFLDAAAIRVEESRERGVVVEMSAGVLDSKKVAGFGALLRQQAAHEKGRENANEEVARWRAPDERQEEERRREYRLEWFLHYSCLAETFRARAEFYERQAEALCRDS